MRKLEKLSRHFFQPIDIMPLVFFRVVFGMIMIWEVWRYFHYDRIYRYYIEPEFYFSYYGFGWVQPLPPDGMVWLFLVLAFLAGCIALGAFYRLAMTLFFFAFTYIFLLDQVQYLNHFYLISLISFLMIFVPAHHKFSVDSLLKPELRSETASLLSLWLIRGQLAIVYVYGGIAKINADWLRGEPMRMWLAERTDFPLIGQWFTEEWMVYAFSYGGLLFDLLIVPLILWKRTRILALILAAGFHLTNNHLFNIGIFPWLALAGTLLFLPPSWFRFWQSLPSAEAKISIDRRKQFLLVATMFYFAIQILLPLRHFLFSGIVSWTEAGHTLAWHMKLRTKDGETVFYASFPDGHTEVIVAENYLTNRQFSQMSDNPDMILRFAQYLSSLDAYQESEIRAWSMMSLNGRASQLMIDPTANLVTQPIDLRADDWILPLVQPAANAVTRPALLISRRENGILMLINITEAPFPLNDLQLISGAETITFDAEHIEVDACLVVQQSSMDSNQIFPICNEASSRVTLSDTVDFWQTDFTIQYNAETFVCDEVVCFVTYPLE